MIGQSSVLCNVYGTNTRVTIVTSIVFEQDETRNFDGRPLYSIIARCYDSHSALLMHITSSGLGYSTQPPFRHGDHDHHDEIGFLCRDNRVTMGYRCYAIVRV